MSIVITRGLDHYLLELYETEYLQATMVKLKVPIDTMTLSEIYSPDKHKINEDVFNNYLLAMNHLVTY